MKKMIFYLKSCVRPFFAALFSSAGGALDGGILRNLRKRLDFLHAVR